MNLLSNVITYVRRLIKSPSDAVISDNLIIDYINRFWIMDMDARLQLFDLKTKYSFQTTPGVDQYNMPLYNIQTDGTSPTQNINFYPVYQGFLEPAYINGVQVPIQTQKNSFFNIWPNIVQNIQSVAIGNGGDTYSFNIPLLSNVSQNPLNPPLQGILRGHVDISGIISTGQNVDPPLVSTTQINNNDPFIESMPVTSVNPGVYITSLGSDGANVIVTDSGQFLESNVNYGLLISPGKAPYGNLPLSAPSPPPRYSITSNTINYFTGQVNVVFPKTIPVGQDINVQCYLFQTGLPRAILFNNNTITLRSPPDTQYLVEMDAYLSPAAFLTSASAIPFAYMSEYIARGAARKILSDTGDVEQFNFYEPLFREQELLVWKRSQRQWTNNRTQTLYSQGFSQGITNNFNGSTL